ncbi:MAG: reverse transcriptase domain-containing protein [Campylobacterota bacterium]|nr:reverse transcriptase domain-containing protein [Campylobacterota bacterium]
MFIYKEIYNAYLKCRKRKRNTINALKFEFDLIKNLDYLETSLNDKTYTPKRSVCFLTTSPKLREVFAADFSDRVIHHLIVPILEQIYEPIFIHDSYSCRKNKGIHYAVKRARKFSKSSKYYLQLDIKNFFYSIDKKILFGILVRKRVVNNFKYKKAKYLESYEKQKGDMSLEEIKKFLSVLASFKGHIKHANSYNLKSKITNLNDEKYIKLLQKESKYAKNI